MASSDSDEDDYTVYIPITQNFGPHFHIEGFGDGSHFLEDVFLGATALPTSVHNPFKDLVRPRKSRRGDRKHRGDWHEDTLSSSSSSRSSSDSELDDYFSTYDAYCYPRYHYPSTCKEKKREKSHSIDNTRQHKRSPSAQVEKRAKPGHKFTGDKILSPDDADTIISKFRSVTMQGEDRHRRNRKSTWCTDSEGNVRVAEICYYSVTSTCRYEDKVCSRLHAHQHYYWQFSNHDRQWYNLPLSWVNSLERKYRDPAQEQVSLSKFDEGESKEEIKHLLSLQSRGGWIANFQSMDLVSSDFMKTYKLRRLCTEKIPGREIESSNFSWYFLDKNSKWVEYGRADTSGNQYMMSSITSSQIESHFQSNPNFPLTFRAAHFKYILDTRRMIQTNQSTGVVRQVRRRPTKDRKQSCSTPNYFSFGMTKMKNDSNLPSSWEAMKPKQRACRVILSSNSAEYKKVIGVLNGEIAPYIISKIERIQNPCLWRAFQNKVDDMTLTYGNIDGVNIRQLFHGTQGHVVDNIISENFDWRLHGTSTGQMHGQGTYFSTRASESYRYCKFDMHGYKYLFIARVAVGTITRGDSTMTRPPINPATNAPYDSTGSGSIIVKYDKQEYYPEYILTLNG